MIGVNAGESKLNFFVEGEEVELAVGSCSLLSLPSVIFLTPPRFVSDDFCVIMLGLKIGAFAACNEVRLFVPVVIDCSNGDLEVSVADVLIVASVDAINEDGVTVD